MHMRRIRIYAHRDLWGKEVDMVPAHRAKSSERLAAGMRLRAVLGAGTAVALLLGGPAQAAGDAPAVQVAQATDTPRAFDIPAQPLADALTAFGRQAGLQVTLNAGIADGLS